MSDNQDVLSAGLITALSLAALFLIAGLWNPLAIPIGLVFLIVAIGVHRRRRWSAYGGALFLAALAALVAIMLLRSAPPNVGRSIAIVVGFFGIAAAFLIREARLMPPGGWRIPWIILAALMFLLPQIFRPFIVSGASMENTILVGDHILVRTFLTTPARGDLVQIRQPGRPANLLPKRVVAIGGDRLRIVQKALVINGLPVTEPHAIFRTDTIEDFRDNFPAEPPPNLDPEWADWIRSHAEGHEIIVPRGKLFVLGDNRDVSLDSRHFGFIDADGITGKPVLIYFSVGRWNRIFKRL